MCTDEVMQKTLDLARRELDNYKRVTVRDYIRRAGKALGITFITLYDDKMCCIYSRTLPWYSAGQRKGETRCLVTCYK